MHSGRWKKPAADLELLDGDVHIWRAHLDQPTGQLAKTLSEDERLRAERFVFEHDRRHYIVGRGGLRTILGRYLNLEPGRLRFCYNDYGKPHLKDLPNGKRRQLYFNVAHSGGRAL